jgi:hypothetical protein
LRINKPRTTVDRQLQALHMLGVCDCDEQAYGADKVRWYYSLAQGISPSALDPKCLPDLLLTPLSTFGEKPVENGSLYTPSNKTGELCGQPRCARCAEPLLSAESVERGHCEECALSAKTPNVKRHKKPAPERPYDVCMLCGQLRADCLCE